MIKDHTTYFNYCADCGWNIKTRDEKLSSATVSICGHCTSHNVCFVGFTPEEYKLFQAIDLTDIREAISLIRDVKEAC